MKIIYDWIILELVRNIIIIFTLIAYFFHYDIHAYSFSVLSIELNSTYIFFYWNLFFQHISVK